MTRNEFYRTKMERTVIDFSLAYKTQKLEQLKPMAKKLGIKSYSRLRKAELIAKINTAVVAHVKAMSIDELINEWLSLGGDMKAMNYHYYSTLNRIESLNELLVAFECMGWTIVDTVKCVDHYRIKLSVDGETCIMEFRLDSLINMVVFVNGNWFDRYIDVIDEIIRETK